MHKPEDATASQESPYWCFISYRHADDRAQDRDWATWLHQEIERYEVPAELVGTRNKRGDIIPARIYPVFRDEVSLPADANLASSIVQALDRSRFLVVLCSPRAVESQYVAEEVMHFKQVGKQDRIVAAILDGEPGHAQKECFPAPLRHPLRENGELDMSSRVEPIAADFRLSDGNQGFTSAEAYRLFLEKDEGLNKKQVKTQADAYGLQLQLMKLKIIAGVLGIPLEQLRNRDQAYQLELARRRTRALRRWLAAIGTLAVLVIVAGIVANQQRINSQIQEFRAINQTLDTSLELVTRFWNDGDVPQALAGLSRAAALSQMINDHPRAAIKEQQRAESLQRKLDLIRQGWRVLSEPEGVRDFAWSADGSRVATLSEQGRIRLWDGSSGRPIAQASTRLGNARKIRLTATGSNVFAAGDRAVQEAYPVYVWKWNSEVQSVEEIYMQGNSDEGQAAGIGDFEMSPRGDLFVIDFLGLILLKQDASGHLVKVNDRDNSADEIIFDKSENLWLGRMQNSFFAIDPASGHVTEFLTGSKEDVESEQSRLLSASGKHYAYTYQMRGGGKVVWMELGEGGTAGELFLKSSLNIADTNISAQDFSLAMLSGNGEILAIPDLSKGNERVILYDNRSGAFVGVFKLPPGRNYARLKFSPTGNTMAAPAPYGLEIWSPFYYEITTESAVKTDTVTPEYIGSDEVISLIDAENVKTVDLSALRNSDEIQHNLHIGSVLRWPDQNHLLVGFSDFKIGYYQIEPFKKEETWTHHFDIESLSEAQKYIQRTERLFLDLEPSPDGRHFISWSRYGGAKIWDLQKPQSPPRTLEPLQEIDQILYGRDNDAIWALYGRNASELSVFRTGGSHALVRTIPVGSGPWIRKTRPDFGIAVFVENWPSMIIDSNTGLALASYFLDSHSMTKPEGIVFSVVDETFAQSVDRPNTGKGENLIDERRTGYRWNSDMAAPIPLSWDELLEIWKDASQ